MILAKFFKSRLYPDEEEAGSGCSQEEKKVSEVPANLASLIMEAQFQCDSEQISKELIVSLINLYTDAIEHYEETCAYKARMYKKRLQVFLMKTSVASVLQGKDSHLILKREIVERTKLQATVNSQEMANRLIEKCEKRVNCSRRLVEKDLKNQQENLEARIERRKSLSNRSINSETDDFDEVPVKGNKNKKLSVNLILSDIKNRNMKKVFI